MKLVIIKCRNFLHVDKQFFGRGEEDKKISKAIIHLAVSNPFFLLFSTETLFLYFSYDTLRKINIIHPIFTSEISLKETSLAGLLLIRLLEMIYPCTKSFLTWTSIFLLINVPLWVVMTLWFQSIETIYYFDAFGDIEQYGALHPKCNALNTSTYFYAMYEYRCEDYECLVHFNKQIRNDDGLNVDCYAIEGPRHEYLEENGLTDEFIECISIFTIDNEPNKIVKIMNFNECYNITSKKDLLLTSQDAYFVWSFVTAWLVLFMMGFCIGIIVLSFCCRRDIQNDQLSRELTTLSKPEEPPPYSET